LSDYPIDLGEGIDACTYFFDQERKEYVLKGMDSSLFFIDAEKGEVKRRVKTTSPATNAVFDSKKNRLIGFSYSWETDQNFVETIDLTTGEIENNIPIEFRNDYYGCVSGLDHETNSYILLSANNQVLMIDTDSGKVNEAYQLEKAVMNLHFIRN
jgi:hypothetical protein